MKRILLAICVIALSLLSYGQGSYERGRLFSTATTLGATTTTFHIVVTNGAGSFLHTGLQFTNTIANAHTERTVGITTLTGRVEIITEGCIIKVYIL